MYKVIDIYWERANLHLKLNKIAKDKVYLKSSKETIILSQIKDEIIINISNTPEGAMLSSGTWNLYINNIITLDDNLIKVLDDKSRIFSYRDGFYAYLVKFSIDENKNLNIITDFMMHNNKPQKFNRIIEASNITDFIKIVLQKLGVICFQASYNFFRIFKRSKNILFFTENSSQITGNLKFLYDYLIENNKKYNIYIYAKNHYHSKNNIYNYLKASLLLARAKVIFLDNYSPLLSRINLSKNTKIIQLWHAGVGFKSVGYARFGLEGSPHPFQSAHRKYTNVIVDSKELITIYQEVFGCKKDIILPIGMPRIDKYLDLNVINKACDKLYNDNPKLKDHKVILFAPTYRGHGNKDAYYDFDNLNFSEIYKYCKRNKSIFVIKNHPFIKECPVSLNEYILDYSNYNINDLIYISDIMITDYSSCVYEYSFFNRPIIYFRYDKELYEYERPIHTLDIFSKNKYEVKNFDELMNTLLKININVNDRFSNITNYQNRNICKNIIEKSLGDL